MATGTGDRLVLYTRDGLPVEVTLQNGVYKLVAHDETTHKLLQELLDKLDAQHEFNINTR